MFRVTYQKINEPSPNKNVRDVNAKNKLHARILVIQAINEIGHEVKILDVSRI